MIFIIGFITGIILCFGVIITIIIFEILLESKRKSITGLIKNEISQNARLIKLRKEITLEDLNS